jgi:hypothetical protein
MRYTHLSNEWGEPAVYDRIRGVSDRAPPIAVCNDKSDAEMIAKALNDVSTRRR